MIIYMVGALGTRDNRHVIIMHCLGGVVDANTLCYLAFREVDGEKGPGVHQSTAGFRPVSAAPPNDRLSSASSPTVSLSSNTATPASIPPAPTGRYVNFRHSQFA